MAEHKTMDTNLILVTAASRNLVEADLSAKVQSCWSQTPLHRLLHQFNCFAQTCRIYRPCRSHRMQELSKVGSKWLLVATSNENRASRSCKASSSPALCKPSTQRSFGYDWRFSEGMTRCASFLSNCADLLSNLYTTS